MAAEVTSPGPSIAKPLHIQRIEKALRLEPLLNYIENIFSEQQSQSEAESSTDAEAENDGDFSRPSYVDEHGNRVYNGIATTKAERRADKTRLYNFSKVKKSRKWLKNILLSDSSSGEEDDAPVTQDRIKRMLKFHKLQKKYQSEFPSDKEHEQYRYYSVGLLSNIDKFYDHQKSILGPKKKLTKEQRKLEKKMKSKLKKAKKEGTAAEIDDDEDADLPPEIREILRQQRHKVAKQQAASKPAKVKKISAEQMAAKRRKIWVSIAKKEIPKVYKQKASAKKEMLTSMKKLAKECQKECKRSAVQSQRIMKETNMRARRLSKEMMVYWKRFEKVEKEHRKKAEKEAQEQRKMNLEIMEMKRQQRKLNFLITQTELYAHFMSKKMTGETDRSEEDILQRLDEEKPKKQFEVDGGILTDVAGDDYDSDRMRALAQQNVQSAYTAHQSKTNAFDSEIASLKGKALDQEALESSLANPAINPETEAPQPSIFEGKLKPYQLKGMNWLANLFNQGINGILADEMGLGKTVQSIAVLAHLAEAYGIWGPFLVIAPASTLHNWQQECSKFVPKLKVVPYWGTTQERRILRQFWNQIHMHTADASFHVVITSYQLVIQDVKYFQKIKWQYMILDEAQAIKSSSSVRWKSLLGFNCRNRLLLTGTPIQNSMAELWALLHFIMPTLFDSHGEFDEWFSKDIESHAERQSGIDQNQLSRLHMILKPFMLRRVKKDVENELSDKIEILVYCPLTMRQKYLYQAIKNKISIEDLLQSTIANTTQGQSSTSSLMNLVMQFRKVCNHPELFERREVRSGFTMFLEPYHIPKRVFREASFDNAIQEKDHLVLNKFFIFNTVHMNQSLHHSDLENERTKEKFVRSCFSFLKFISMSPGELSSIMLSGLLVRWYAILLSVKQGYKLHHSWFWHKKEEPKIHIHNTGFLLQPLQTTHYANVEFSTNLQGLAFTNHNSTVYTFTNHQLNSCRETIWHQKIRLRKLLEDRTKKTGAGTPSSPVKGKAGTRTPLSPTKKTHTQEFLEENIHKHIPRPPRILDCRPTELPSFLFYTQAKVISKPLETFCSDRTAEWKKQSGQLCGTLEARNALLCGTQELYEHWRYAKFWFKPETPGGLYGVQPKHGYSKVIVPDKEVLVSDAGKLTVLDSLLQKLKAEGHRVLIYSQMTRMIDLLEEYMWHRKHTYMRLDGSSKISDRRDMVADFQTRSDIFVFLLSTRAGGLGINLTAADTVIFYDSDWNPTVDQQAMDRAHRLGQTKQVTVYRLICKGTIEERILQRAKEKSEIQRMVISGGQFRPDVLKPKEVVSLLLDDDEMESKLQQKQEERLMPSSEKDKKRKKEKLYSDKPDPVPGFKRRGPGRPRKKRPVEENVTVAAPELDTTISMDSMSAAASPQSVVSLGSEFNPFANIGDESSNDALLIVDDHPTFPPVSSNAPPPPKRGKGRPRGRPRGSGVGRRPRGRGSVQKAISAAENAAAQAAKTAAYAAYGYSFSGSGLLGNKSLSQSPTPSSTSGTPRDSPRMFTNQPSQQPPSN